MELSSNVICGLSRKVKMECDVISFRDFLPYLDLYHNPSVISSVTSTYSKISAIDALYDTVSERSISNRVAMGMVRALFTDHGLLYSQTREYGDPDAMDHWLTRQEDEKDVPDPPMSEVPMDSLEKAIREATRRIYLPPEMVHETELSNKVSDFKKPAPYSPHIPASRIQPFLKQVCRYEAYDLTLRFPLDLDPLKRLLHPSIPPNMHRKQLEEYHGVEKCQDMLFQVFKAYRDDAGIHPVNCKDYTLEQICSHFIRTAVTDKKTKRLIPCYFTHPEWIFYLFRSIRYNELNRLEKSSLRAILDAGTAVALIKPALPATRTLFHGIVNVCAEGCRLHNISFDPVLWMESWDLFSAGIECVQYPLYSLLTYASLLTQALFLHEEEKAAVDKYFHSLLNGPGASVLFSRAFTTSFHSSKLAPFLEKAAAYKAIFTDADRHNTREQYEIIESISTMFRWNKASVMPKGHAESTFLSDLIRDSDTNRLEASRDGGKTKPVKGKLFHQDAYNVITEWILLQHICDQSARKLLDTAVILLERMQNETS